jgi:hypothetical protein
VHLKHTDEKKKLSNHTSAFNYCCSTGRAIARAKHYDQYSTQPATDSVPTYYTEINIKSSKKNISKISVLTSNMNGDVQNGTELPNWRRATNKTTLV